ncbi:MAG: PAS domain S-box protein, partial [Anaerolineales bacterium]|nr:PAS domain S-box protein [Anaerolineales bacterium]
DTAQILDANPAAESYYGYPLATLKAMTMMQINVADEQTIREKIQKILAKEISSCPFKQRLADGTIRDVEVFATAIDYDGQQVLYSAFIDVTDRNRFQAALQEANQELEERVQARTQALEQSRDRLEAIFNHSGDGILLVDTKLRIQQSNYAVGKMFRITDDDFTNQMLSAIIASNDGVELETVVQRIIHFHVTERIEAQGMRADGTQFAAEISIAPINRSDRAVENMVCIIRDISERKQAEAERQQHLALIEDLYNNAPTGYHSTDANNVIIQINDTELKWLGYTRDEVVGKRKSSDFLTPASLERWAESLPLLIEQNEVAGLELELVRKDGTTFWIAGSASAIRDKDGKFLRTRTVVHDITELKQAQNTIAEERNLLRTVIDAVPDYIYVKDTQHRMILNNVSHTQSLGASMPADVIGKTDFDLFPEAMARKFHADEKALLEDGAAIINVEERAVSVDGHEIWALTTKVPLRNIQGELTGLVGITRNIDDLKQKEDALLRSEQQLRESEHMLQLVLDSIPVRVFWKDLNLNYLGCNRLFADDAGLADTNTIIGRSDLDMPWAEEQAEAYRADDRKVIANGVAKLNYEEPQLNSEGKWITLLTSKIPMRDVNNEIVGMLGTYIDITERKDAEEQLRYLASLQAFISDSVVSLDLSLHIQSWNKAAETMFGWQAEEVIGRTLHEIIEIDIPGQEFDEAIQELYKAGYWYGESRIYDRDGTPKNLSSSIGFTRDEAGQPTGFITVHHDISERVRAEQALQQSEEQYRMLAENVKDVIVKLDIEGHVLFATPSTTVMLGYTPDDLNGMNGFSIVHPDDLERVRETLLTAYAAGSTSFQIEERLRHKDGHYIWVDAASNIIYDPDTKMPVETVGVMRDITGRKTTELALRASEERFRLFIESAPIATVISNIDGRIMLLNRAAEQLLGYTQAEIVGQRARILVPNHRDELQQLLFSDHVPGKHGQQTAALELSMQKKDGQMFAAEVQLSQVQIEQETLVMAFVLDITERKKAETTLKQALEKEKELGELKSRFVSMASHQFRTPLTAILASAETLTYYRDRMDDAQIDMRLDRIRNQVAFMKTIMEDVLELARIQANQVRYQPVEGDLDAMCQEIIEDFEHQKAYTGRISYKATPSPLNAKFDPHLMHHLISNLVHNALKYSAAETP